MDRGTVDDWMYYNKHFVVKKVNKKKFWWSSGAGYPTCILGDPGLNPGQGSHGFFIVIVLLLPYGIIRSSIFHFHISLPARGQSGPKNRSIRSFFDLLIKSERFFCIALYLYYIYARL